MMSVPYYAKDIVKGTVLAFALALTITNRNINGGIDDDGFYKRVFYNEGRRCDFICKNEAQYFC
jgi:hypothetical protein